MKTQEQMMTERPTGITAEQIVRMAVVYVRLSTRPEGAADQAALDAQRAQAEHARRWGWPAERILVIEDLGQPGTMTPTRDGFHQLCRMIEAGHVGLVLVSDFSRLSRSRAELADFLTICNAMDTQVAVDGCLADCTDPEGNYLLRMRSLLRECERSCLALATEQPLARRGWRAVQLKHPPGPQIREILRRYVAGGKSLTEIAEELNNEDFRTTDERNAQ